MQAPEVAQERLWEIELLLAAEHRELRFFIEELKPAPLGIIGGDSNLDAALGGLAERIDRHWGLGVELKTDRLGEARIPGDLAKEIYHIVREALVNVVRHASASKVRADVGADGGQVRVSVVDDGRGFPFQGHYDHAALTELNLGPVSLRERIASLGGTLAIKSAETGTCLQITLPFVRPEGR